MKLIVGLGNPGSDYVHTRHNLGAEVVAFLASHLHVDMSHRSLHADWGRGSAGPTAFILAQPQTYMNLSGTAVVALAHYFKILPEDILVVVDDFNLPLGTLRFRSEGSAGGHNGLKSVIECMGVQAFHRLRLGIGTPAAKAGITDYVLGRFHGEEIAAVKDLIPRAAEAAQCWLEHGISRAMTGYN